MTDPRRLAPSQRWLRLGIVAAGALAVLVVAWLPGQLPRPVFPCAFHAITGLPCLFCGGTRSVRAVLHGEFALAAYLNPIGFLALGAGAALLLVLLLEAARGSALADWDNLLRRITKNAPLIFVVAAALWLAHVVAALRTPKPELVNLANPFARAVKSALSAPPR